jgi:hypothetical protein
MPVRIRRRRRFGGLAGGGEIAAECSTSEGGVLDTEMLSAGAEGLAFREFN